MSPCVPFVTGRDLSYRTEFKIPLRLLRKQIDVHTTSCAQGGKAKTSVVHGDSDSVVELDKVIIEEFRMDIQAYLVLLDISRSLPKCRRGVVKRRIPRYARWHCGPVTPDLGSS